LLRGGVSKDKIGKMLAHSNSTVTEHYLAGLEIEKHLKLILFCSNLWYIFCQILKKSGKNQSQTEEFENNRIFGLA